MSRKVIAAGNWKMNKTPKEAVEFVQALKGRVADADTEVVVGVPFVCLPGVVEAAKGSNIKVAAQNMHWEEKGAFTGEVSGPMLAELGVDYVIIGHSERRQYFGETDETVNKKVHAAFKYGLKPIICVGESLTQREQGVTAELVRYQVKIALLGLSAEQVKEAVIAYEPIWAIGTGKTATNEQAEEVCGIIRECIKELYGQDVAEAIRIQYGGSVNAANAAELFNMPNIDGGLVGGASLKLDDFEKIAKYNK
ncbi:MAG TPA: triose-phosphate isomerase [Hungateiclostridium thermocellum]|jgi:triosephosphate isomerase|uniref:Triosephosphate isomerase n=2 Tax=Acetivibrio thermocellus TaxID=1515 RepID=TPIS_ACET2|nr:triose-phosphate isomerase [Acetivibrio thermocellus]A3DBQ1.1 RecName: Full=Triosephosphate isomerase; Short=TIM; Short=TPI; AltName: Full=Triose-phosphate isomerase [Acetivibrio thermocellus ATCC 27405]CDG34821.1 Triosephosphate isomerase [Acetivibrio thermocellus BC1]ABN51380.1 triosephosphate isomerase [Acetivibrio thermocellus ATCC 27405]ADU75134.1 triosephosphate isomerase [Acetivibrio thermocellus DSM 1313]ALX09109.1 Triosephosphate isomerase, bacterial/eukaryotic [Acetivibrio thermoc